jgi:hypothetical protein
MIVRLAAPSRCVRLTSHVTALVVIAKLLDQQRVTFGLVHRAVLVGDPPRPISGQGMFKRLRLADSGERLSRGISSWVNEELTMCYQVMETLDQSLLEEWMRNWADVVEFEVHPVITSQEAARRI